MKLQIVRDSLSKLDIDWKSASMTSKLDALKKLTYEVYRALNEMNEESTNAWKVKDAFLASSWAMFHLIKEGLDPSVLCEEGFARLLNGAYSISVAGRSLDTSGRNTKTFLSSNIIMREKEWIASHEGYLQYLDELENDD